jgi:hypothetical protein
MLYYILQFGIIFDVYEIFLNIGFLIMIFAFHMDFIKEKNMKEYLCISYKLYLEREMSTS